MKLGLRRSGVAVLLDADGTAFTLRGEPAKHEVRLAYRANDANEPTVRIIDTAGSADEETCTIEISSWFIADAISRVFREETGAVGLAEILTTPSSNGALVAREFAAAGVSETERLQIARDVVRLEALRRGRKRAKKLPKALDPATRQEQEVAWAAADAFEIGLRRRVFLEEAATRVFRERVGQRIALAIQQTLEEAAHAARGEEEKRAGVAGLPSAGPIPRRRTRGGQPRGNLQDFLAFAAENLRTRRPKIDQFGDSQPEDTGKYRHDKGKLVFEYCQSLLRKRN